MPKGARIRNAMAGPFHARLAQSLAKTSLFPVFCSEKRGMWFAAQKEL
jgi:hypothetical protein